MSLQFGLWLALVLAAAWPATAGSAWIEAPVLTERISRGELPPMAQRLPRPPSVVSFDATELSPGRYGGDIRTLASRGRDVRLLVVYGYARLVAYDRDYRIVPDILEAIEVDADRVFTLHLRENHRWSDGEPFTAEDFRYYWEDIVSNEALAPFGPPKVLVADGEPARFEVLGPRTVRYTWAVPNPFFLPALAAARPETIYAPAHYLKQFHARYTDADELAAMAKAERRRNWVAVHANRFRPYRNTNPDLPTLQPWINTTSQPSQRFVFVRNPYYHRVDVNGRQLPYVDRVIMNLVDAKLIPAKTGVGESDLQTRALQFSDYPFLKQGEKRGQVRVLLWDTTKGAHIALHPNLNVVDPAWRSLMRDVRFRRALSLATHRREINQVFFYGLAREGNDTVGPSSPLFEPRLRDAWARYDLDEANALLDQIGLTQRNREGVRLLPDGRPLQVLVETAGEDPLQSDILQLMASTWLEAGVKLFIKPLQREVFRNRIYAGQTLMSVWGGLENGLPNAYMSPRELAPTSQDQLQWPMWGQYYETGGALGEPVDLPAARRLQELNDAWVTAPGIAAREAIWRQMLEIRAEQVFTIGVVAGVPQPIVFHPKLRNVPDRGIYNWDPGAHFGIHRPDTFWYDEE